MDEMLAHIQHGIILFDKDHRLVTHNALVERMLDLPPDLLRRGRSSDEAVLALLALGEYGSDRRPRHSSVAGAGATSTTPTSISG